MQVSVNQLEFDILEQPRFPCCGVGMCHTSIGLVLMIVKEIDQKLTLGMAESSKRRRTKSPPDEES